MNGVSIRNGDIKIVKCSDRALNMYRDLLKASSPVYANSNSTIKNTLAS